MDHALGQPGGKECSRNDTVVSDYVSKGHTDFSWYLFEN